MQASQGNNQSKQNHRQIKIDRKYLCLLSGFGKMSVKILAVWNEGGAVVWRLFFSESQPHKNETTSQHYHGDALEFTLRKCNYEDTHPWMFCCWRAPHCPHRILTPTNVDLRHSQTVHSLWQVLWSHLRHQRWKNQWPFGDVTLMVQRCSPPYIT